MNRTKGTIKLRIFLETVFGVVRDKSNRTAEIGSSFQKKEVVIRLHRHCQR